MKTKVILSVMAIFMALTTLTAKDIKSVSLKVEDMMCEVHEAKITNMLRFEKGVKEIKTDVPARLVIIKYDAEKTTPEKLIKSFKKVDCTAVLLPENKINENKNQKQK